MEIAYIILTVVLTAVGTLLVQMIVQLRIAPRADAERRSRERREERWTAALDALMNLLTCSLNKRRLPGAAVDEDRVDAFYDLVSPNVQVYGSQVAAFALPGVTIGAFEAALAAYVDQAARTHQMRLAADRRGLAAAWKDERAARLELIGQAQLLQDAVSARLGARAARPAVASA